MQSIEVSYSLPCLKQVELFRMQLVVVRYPLIFNTVMTDAEHRGIGNQDKRYLKFSAFNKGATSDMSNVS